LPHKGRRFGAAAGNRKIVKAAISLSGSMTNEGGTAGILVPVTIVTGTFLFAKQRRK